MNKTLNETSMTKMEYNYKLKKYQELRKSLKETSNAKIAAAYAEPGNTWHDNFDYEQLDLQEDSLFSRLEELANIINNATIIEQRKPKDKNVDIYDVLKLLFIYDKDDQEELILSLGKGYSDNNITLSSPLGKAIYNKPYGSHIKYSVNGKKITVKIIEKIN